MNAIAPMKYRERQAGFSLIASIFILVVLAMLGAFMVTIGAVQRTTVVQSLQAARAYQAASAGIEWGIQNALTAGTCAAAFALADPVLSGFQVNVTCTTTNHEEANNCFSVYNIRSFAQSGALGDPYFVSRQIEAKVTSAPGTPKPPGGCP